VDPAAVGTVCVVGSANVDLVARVAQLPRPGETVLATGYRTIPGGKGRNQAIAAARCGARVAFVGCVGDDPEGDLLLTSLTSESIDVTGLTRVAGPTGRAFISVSDDGENAIVVVAGANAAVLAPSVHAAAQQLSAAGAVLAQLEVADAAVATAFDLGRSAGAITILNAAPARDITTLLPSTDVLIVNEHEASFLAATAVTDVDAAVEAAAALCDAGPATVVVTLGADGAIAVRGEEVLRRGSFPVDVVDTTGAGDAASGALAAALAGGADLETALARACAAGALAVSELGASPAALTGTAIERLVSGAG
jgi:ribokinase